SRSKNMSFSLQNQWTWDILPVFAGMNGTAIENFVCVIFNVSFMNCTWDVGSTASGDTQYFLYWKNSWKEDFTECQNYIRDNYGRRTGCRFQNVKIENKVAHFLVNASSNGQNIQLHEDFIKKLTPPLNVTVNCTEASHHCEIRWQPPRTSQDLLFCGFPLCSLLSHQSLFITSFTNPLCICSCFL
uniref:Type I cytokine receptor cytokine-binding domain-containing protein n=1 Tax=Buteo japonicus TaxID=224669 RepID=A0A8C0BRD6_9AVES